MTKYRLHVKAARDLARQIESHCTRMEDARTCPECESYYKDMAYHLAQAFAILATQGDGNEQA